MILRSITRHVHDQNWVAVGIDFLIVVVGVFIGIQVSNWNEARGAALRELEYLEQLIDEIESNNELLDYRVSYTKAVVSAGARMAVFMESDTACEGQCTEILIDAFHASQLWGADVRDDVSTEMQRQGLPRSIDLKKKLRFYQRFTDGLETTLENAAQYRERSRRLTPLATQRLLWAACYVLEKNTLEVLVTGCDVDVPDIEAAQILAGFRSAEGLLGDLNYWIGQNDLWRTVFEDHIDLGTQLIADIKDEIGARR